MAHDPRQAAQRALVGRRSTHRGGAVPSQASPGRQLRNALASAAAGPPSWLRECGKRDCSTRHRHQRRDAAGRRRCWAPTQTGHWCSLLTCGPRTGAWLWRASTACRRWWPQAAYAGDELDPVLAQLSNAIGAIYRRKSKRLRAIAVSVAGTISGAKLVQFTSRGWHDVDLSVLTAKIPDRAGVRLLLGNDATLAGLAEARTGAARSAATALYLIVAQGIGGTLVVNGEPLAGAHGAAGEYGHIPFGDPTLVCPCGAHGCWDLTVDGRALARHRGDGPPADPVAYVHDLVGRPKRDAATRRAFDAVAASLGRGTGGLVNLHDPEVVTLGGVAARLQSRRARRLR